MILHVTSLSQNGDYIKSQLIAFVSRVKAPEQESPSSSEPFARHDLIANMQHEFYCHYRLQVQTYVIDMTFTFLLSLMLKKYRLPSSN